MKIFPDEIYNVPAIRYYWQPNCAMLYQLVKLIIVHESILHFTIDHAMNAFYYTYMHYQYTHVPVN